MSWNEDRRPRLAEGGCRLVRRVCPACLAALVVPAGLAAGDVVINEIMHHPASNDVREEYLELYNRGPVPVDLTGWRLSAGVEFTFPAVEIPPGGFQVVAADPEVFLDRHPGVTNVVGGWTGQLGDNGEKLTLRDAAGATVDSVNYATQGDWGVRAKGPRHLAHYGWIWQAAHDGGGASLELIGAHRSNNVGQNWASSLEVGGTPGRANSVAVTDLPPFIRGVKHRPVVPRSTDPVWITAEVTDESLVGVEVKLHWRVDGAPSFEVLPMADDGQHGDGRPFDQVFGAALPAQPADTVVEFYVEARDRGGLSRTWPAPVQPSGEQLANCLYQVSDTSYQGTLPLFRVIVTAQEMAEIAENDSRQWALSSDAEYNATFISEEAGEFELRYRASFRVRGNTSRGNPVKNRRVRFPNDAPWHGQRAININAHFPQSQQLVAAVYRLAGLGAPTARAVRLRENNVDKADGGVYVEAEVLNSDFARRQFPLDPNGNLYRSNSDLSYQGDDPEHYRSKRLYTKQTNSGADDWSDLIDLLRALNETPDDRYVEEVYRVWNVPAWIRYFALETLLSNQETSLGTGKVGDFAMYRGLRDTRFVPVPYDSDSYFGVITGVHTPLWRATRLETVKRFLTHPAFAPLYHAELRRLMDGPVQSARLDPLIDQLLGPWMDEAGRQKIKDFMAARLAFVRETLPPPGLEVTADLPSGAYPYTDSSTIPLSGTADAALTRSVLVNGIPAAWDPVEGLWSLAELPLQPGVNRIFIQTFDDAGRELTSRHWSVWRNDRPGVARDGEITTDTVWTAATGPHLVNTRVTVQPGATLTIEPGSSVFFGPAASLRVSGRLLAEGVATNPIYFTRVPDTSGSWGGIQFENATNENRLRHVFFEHTRYETLLVTNSVLRLEDADWGSIIGMAVKVRNASFEARRCRFPETRNYEPVAGAGILPGGRFIIEDSHFGPATGYSDIIDFTDTGNDEAVVIIRHNVFTGGTDDALDLDGTVALIEGNIFRHFHKDNSNSSTSESGAIAAGSYDGRPARLTVVRNIFEDNDFGMILKERLQARVENNTFLHHTKAALGFQEPGRPWESPADTVELVGNIFADESLLFGNLHTNDLTSGALTLTARQNLFPPGLGWPGEDNLHGDPRFAAPPEDLHLRPGSPALGRGPNGLDQGALAPAGASIGGEPWAVTGLTSATLTIGGPAIVEYRWRLDDTATWSDPTPVSEPLVLTDLAPGRHRVEVLGRNVAGEWQPEDAPTRSRAWTVVPDLPGARLSEVLAWNRTLAEPDGATPDLVELVNEQAVPVDLTGFRLTDDLQAPDRFTFPADTILPPEGRLVVWAAAAGPPERLPLGFALDPDGDALYLLPPAEQGNAPVDEVVFGPQLPDYSLARAADGSWRLARPTFGEANAPVRTGDPRGLRLSEWLAHPALPGGDDFVELYNPDDLPVALGGMRLSDEPVGDPAATTLPPLSFIGPRDYLLLRADGRTGGRRLDFRLDAEQGMVALFDATGALVDEAVYEFQWPGVSSGRPDPAGWEVVNYDWPTPGGPPLVSADGSPVVLNELLADNRSYPGPGGGPADWIEVMNVSDSPVLLEGMSLSDRGEEPRRWSFPAGLTLPPGGRWVVDCDPARPAGERNTGFGLSAAGETVFLFDPAGRVLDQVAFGLQAADWSLGRAPDGVGGWQVGVPTPEAGNRQVATAPLTGLKVNEWMAAPAQGDDWFELFNPADAPVALAGLGFSDAPNAAPSLRLPALSFLGTGVGAYRQFRADNHPGAGADHVDFKLAAGGESIALSGPDDVVFELVTFGPQERGVSEGRFPDGAGTVVRFPDGATPGEANRMAAALRLALSLQPDGGVSLEWNTIPGPTYRLQAVGALPAAEEDWETLTEVVGTGEPARYVDAPVGATPRFYRVVRLP